MSTFVTGTEAKDDFLSMAEAARRLADVIVMRPGKHRFNFLSSTDAEIVDRNRQADGGDAFWAAKADELLRRLALIDESFKGGSF